MLKLNASCDIGTNSVLLLVASFENGRLIPRLEKISEPRIGKELHDSGEISPQGLKRLSDCLLDFRKTLSRVGARMVGLAGTQALREAKNSAEVVGKIEGLLYHPCRILSGEEEAAFTALALEHQYRQSNITLADIGGGSTEITVANKNVSIPIGAVRMSNANGSQMEKHRQSAAEAVEALPKSRKKKGVFGVGGTFTTLAMMQKSLIQFCSEDIEGTVISLGEISQWIEKLADLSVEERGNVVGLPKSRRDIIVPGLCIAEALMLYWKIEEITVSTWGLRHGLILQHLHN